LRRLATAPHVLEIQQMKTKKYLFWFADRVHHANAAICAFLLLVLFFIQIVVVVLRYVFGIGYLELQDIVAYSFAAIVVLSIPVALRADKHVRVDILRRIQSPVTARALDNLAILALLGPVFILIIVFVMPDILYAWRIREGSVETGGLPGYFLVKTCLPIACLLCLLQAAALLFGAGMLDNEGKPETDGI
jgi:TRAP-type mannitol/chloroaromatic compound transport system permease small subunit